MIVHATVLTAERAGIERARFLQLAQFDPERLKVPDGHVTCAEFYRMCELALDLIGDPALGLHEGEAMSGGSYNLVAHLVSNTTSLRKGLETLLEFQKLLTRHARFQVVEQERSFLVRRLGLGSEPARVLRFMAELDMTGFLRLVRYFAPAARPEQVRFEYSAPPYRSEYTRIFDGTECFEQAFTEIVFDRALMDALPPYNDEQLHSALRTEAEQRLSQLTQPTPYTDRVRDFILKHAAPSCIEMDAIARAVDLSERSLRRRLAAEGTSYQALVNGTLENLAKRYLREQRSIQATAHAMGYADSGAFHRAFKRWTGMTPRAFMTKRER